MFAMLLAMTSTLSSWAIIPVAAVFSARMASVLAYSFVCACSRRRAVIRRAATCVVSARHGGELLDGVLVQVALVLQQQGDLRVGARELDQARDFDHAVDVRLLDRALDQRRRGVGQCHDAGRR